MEHEPMETKAQTVYLIRPKLGGLANDMLILTEDRDILYHVRSMPFSPIGRVYSVCDVSMQEVFRTKQDHTALFPRHTVFKSGQENVAVAKVGQLGVIPQQFFADIRQAPRLIVRIPVFESIFQLANKQDITAEIAQHRSTWIVVISTKQDHPLILSIIAITYREYTIGG